MLSTKKNPFLSHSFKEALEKTCLILIKIVYIVSFKIGDLVTVNNFLNSPQSIYGLPGIKMGNLIYQTLKEKNLETEYNFATCITVLDSSDLPISALDILKDLFDKPPRPTIKEKRDANGNLQIDLPQQDKPSLELTYDFLKLSLKILMNAHFIR